MGKDHGLSIEEKNSLVNAIERAAQTKMVQQATMGYGEEAYRKAEQDLEGVSVGFKVAFFQAATSGEVLDFDPLDSRWVTHLPMLLGTVQESDFADTDLADRLFAWTNDVRALSPDVIVAVNPVGLHLAVLCRLAHRYLIPVAFYLDNQLDWDIVLDKLDNLSREEATPTAFALKEAVVAVRSMLDVQKGA